VNIRIAPQVLSESRWHPVLDAIVEIVIQSDSHASFDLRQYQLLASSSWLKGASGPRANIAEVIRAAARTMGRSVPVGAVTLEVDTSAPQCGELLTNGVMRFPPLKALVVLAMPLQVIVEDETSDGGFVLWMARLLGKDTLRAAYNAGRISFRHAGGKTQMVKAARALSYGVWQRENRPILLLKYRAVAILDSDARHETDSPNEAIRQELEPHVAFAHVLKGRTIENYVPLRFAVKRLQNLTEQVEAYFQLTEEQRRFFPLKRGFKNTDTPPQAQSMPTFQADIRWSTPEKQLFSAISPTEWIKFSGGFGDTLADVFSEARYRCNPGQVDLLTQTQRAELDQVITMILRHI
jgi:hypothetical protein